MIGDFGSLVRDNWGIAAAMAAGSYVAGSTPMGGGTVGFPVLVLIFDQSGAMGRDFAFAIQSIGMVSASVFILTRPKIDQCKAGSRAKSRSLDDWTSDENHREQRGSAQGLGNTKRAQNDNDSSPPALDLLSHDAPQSSPETVHTFDSVDCSNQLEWELIRPAMLGSLISTPLGILWLAPRLPDLSVKLIFAVIWASFGLMHLVKLREFVLYSGGRTRWDSRRVEIGFAVGVLGGLISSITGVGIDMILYATMVLLFQADLKVSTPSSVIVMAFTSVVGITWTIFLHWWQPLEFPIDPAVFPSWLAAAPVVAVGAPIGAWAVQKLPRVPTLILISLLCLAQFIWTLLQERVDAFGCVIALGSVLLMNLGFHFLYRLGKKTNRYAPPA